MSRKPPPVRDFPLRVRLASGRIVHAAYTHGLYVDGAGMTACRILFSPDDTQLPENTNVDCAHCLQHSAMKETSQ
ncbi:hypothetical protein [Streptacidiphilus carbonis]|uniref:hypothetical protein n=1 Tax=Streptacidiphilus carbonis TaxID=105422 RepID=UPI0005A798C2|nr:hypothetical protein [Streptacidiphilus carbonis]